MSKSRTAPVINFADFKKKAAEEYSLVIDLGDGVSVRYRGPELLSDADMARMAELQGSNDPAAAIEVAKIMVDDYDTFAAHGGSATLLMAMVQDEQQRRTGDAEGERLGESVPSSDS